MLSRHVIFSVSVLLGLSDASSDSIDDRSGPVPPASQSAAAPDTAHLNQEQNDVSRKSAVTALARALGDDHWHVRANAVDALGAIGDLNEMVAPLLFALVKDKAMVVRATVTVTLGSFGKSIERRWCRH